MNPSADLKARLLAEVKQAPSATRGDQRRLTIGLTLLVTAMVGYGYATSPGYTPGDRPLLLIVGTSAAWLVSIAALLVALRSRGQLGPPGAVLWTVVFGSLALPVAVGLLGNWIDPSTAIPVLSRPGIQCFERSLAWSTAPLTAFAFIRRESDPVHPVALGAAFGALAACVSGFLVNLICKFANPPHIALGHLLPGLIEVGLGAMMGYLVISVRRSRSPALTGAALGAAVGGWFGMMVDVHLQVLCPIQTEIDPQELTWLLGGMAVGALAGALLGSLQSRGEVRR